MKSPDALVGQQQGFVHWLGTLRRQLVPAGIGQKRIGQVCTVEARGQLAHGLVTSRANSGDDLPHDLGGRLARLRAQLPRLLVLQRIVEVQDADHPSFSNSGSSSSTLSR
jgi:hypothetical protein